MTEISIRPYSEGDYEVVKREMGDPEMTKYLWLESPEKLKARHKKYMHLPEKGNDRMYVIELAAESLPAGGVGYWEIEQDGEKAWETGWSVFPEFQSQGIATKATVLAMDLARASKLHRYVYAFPAAENAPSNAICKKLGFELQKQHEEEFPDGRKMTLNIWRLDLFANA
jgi:RimJ/RimL family protein N-acetyltransferase